MDIQTIAEALLASIGADNTQRTQAYTYLESIKLSPNFLQILLELILNDTNSQLAQISAIYVKNLVRNWNSELWRPEDKQLVRKSLLFLMRPNVPDKVRLQFEEVASLIYKTELPSQELHSELLLALQSEESLYAGLSLLSQVCKQYEFATNAPKRAILTGLSETFMPILIELLEKLLNRASNEAFQYIQIVLATYWSAAYFEVPQVLCTEDALRKWMSCFMNILASPLLDPGLSPADAETVAQWVCKKWSAQIVFRFFNRYFIKLYLKGQNLFICEYFQSNWAVPFFKLIVSAVFNQKNQFLTDSVLNFYLKYITQAIKFEPLLKEFKPELAGRVLIHICLPLLALKESDQELWTENPVEFIRKNEDEIRAYYSKKTSAISLILSLCEKGYLVPFFNFINAEIVKTSELSKKEALMLALGSISELAKTSDRLKPEIQMLLENHILQEYHCSNGFLKYRCAWVFGKYAQVAFGSSVQEAVLKRTCQLMVEPELPVRYSASLALARFLNWEVSKAQLATEIQHLLKIYLKLIDEIDSEEVIESLESIISVFPAEMMPFSCELAQILVVNFEKYMKEGKEEGNMPAFSTLNTIAKIVEVAQNHPEAIFKLSFILQKLLETLVRIKDYTEEFCNILVGLLYFSPIDSLTHLYSIFEPFWISILGVDANEETALLDSANAEEMFPCLANFITKFPTKTVEHMTQIVSNACVLLDRDEEYLFLACQILVVLLENFKLDELKRLIPQIILQITEQFTSDLSKKYKISCCQVVFTCIWNAPEVVIQIYPSLKPFLDYCCTNFRHFSEYLAKVHMILGIGSFFTFTPPAEILVPDLPKYFKVLFLCAADGKIDDIDDQEIKEIHKVDLTLNYNTTDDCSEEEEYEDYPFGIEPVNNFTFCFESQDPTEAYKQFLSFIQSKSEYSGLFSTLTPNETKILSYILE